LALIEEGLPAPEKSLPKRKPVTTRDYTVTFNLKKLVVPALAVLIIAAAAIILVKVNRGKNEISIAPPASGKPSLAVMYFENQTEKPGLDKMAVILLTTNLSRNEGLEVTSTQRLFDILKRLDKQDAQTIDKSLATEVATRAGVKTMLIGSIIQIGGQIRLTSELIDVKTGSIVGTQSEDGTKYDDLFAMVDGITEQVGQQLGGGGTAGGLKVADVTTSSLEALEQYQKGLDLMMRWDNPSAANLLRKAIEIDPRFGMAYAYLAIAELSNMISVFDPYTDLTEAKRTLESAKRYSDRATASELIIIQMIEALLNRDLTKAARFGRELLARNIPVKWAYTSIINEQWRKQDFQGAMRTAEKMIEDDPAEANAYNALAYSYGFLHDYPAAISAINRYIAAHPDDPNTFDSAWEMRMWAGKYDEAVRSADEASRARPNLIWPDYLAASWALVHKGQAEAARERFPRLERISPDWRGTATFFLGLSYLSEGRHREAQGEFLRALGTAQANGQKRDEMMFRFFLGEALLIHDNADQALAQFEEAEKASPQYYQHDFNPIPVTRRFYAGRAFLKKGRIDQAVSAAEEISRIISEQGLPAEFLDFRSILEAEISLARNKPEDTLRILEKTGNAAAAKDHYQKFLERMRAADPGIPEVADARKRLAALG
jgi:tetratricopeptide (TPR) repeat protein